MRFFARSEITWVALPVLIIADQHYSNAILDMQVTPLLKTPFYGRRSICCNGGWAEPEGLFV